MKKLTLTALLTLTTLTGIAFATPSRVHHLQMDYTAYQTDQVQYTSNAIIAPRLTAGMNENDPAMQAQLASYIPSTDRITPQVAADLAFSQAPGTVQSVRLGVDKGVLIYEVVVGRTEVAINAATGAVWGQNELFSSSSAAMAESQGNDPVQ